MKNIVLIVVFCVSLWLFYYSVYFFRKKESDMAFLKQYTTNKWVPLCCLFFVGANTWYIYGIGSMLEYVLMYTLCFTVEVPLIYFATDKDKRRDHIVEIVSSLIILVILFAIIPVLKCR